MQTIKITGLKELLNALHQLPHRVAKNVSRRAVAAGANIIRDAARQQAPVKTGTLKKNIVARGSRGSKWVAASKVFIKKLTKKQLLKIKTNIHLGKMKRISGKYKGDAFYWIYVHFGTRPHIIPKSKGFIQAAGYPHPIKRIIHPGARKQPFLSRAFEFNKMEAVKIIKKSFVQGIEFEATKLGKPSGIILR